VLGRQGCVQVDGSLLLPLLLLLLLLLLPLLLLLLLLLLLSLLQTKGANRQHSPVSDG
jgi:hypothetical protein